MGLPNLAPVLGLFARVIKGVGGVIMQFYDEVNKKRGKQWEASRLVYAANKGDKFYSIIKMGSLPFDLKARVLGATGAGVIGRTYKIQASDVTLGNPDPWYNFNSIIPILPTRVQPETELYAGAEITFITPVINLAVQANKIHADIFAITNAQNQAKGLISQSFGGNHILNPFDYILLELESYDAAQDIMATLEGYEGPLDFKAE